MSSALLPPPLSCRRAPDAATLLPLRCRPAAVSVHVEYDGGQRVSYALYSKSKYVPSRSLDVSYALISSLLKPNLYKLCMHLPNSDNTGADGGIITVVY
jgi:hypothetical protein